MFSNKLCTIIVASYIKESHHAREDSILLSGRLPFMHQFVHVYFGNDTSRMFFCNIYRCRKFKKSSPIVTPFKCVKP